MKGQYNIGVIDSSGEMDADSNLVVYYDRQASSHRVLYHVTIRLKGRDLPYVASASYHLPSLFRERICRVDRASSNPDCRLTIWTSGMFSVLVVITLKSAKRIAVDYRLRYGEAMQAQRRAGRLELRDVNRVDPGAWTLALAATKLEG